MINKVHAGYPQGGALPKFIQSSLTDINKCVYSFCVAAKSVTGISTPFDNPVHSRQLINVAGFFMRTICTHLCNSLGKLHLNYGGLIEGASARRVRVYGSTNLDQPTTSQRLVPLGGGYKKPYPEAVTMTTTPTQAVTTAMIYTFAIAGGTRFPSNIKRIRTISTCAKSEQEARQALFGLPLVFVCSTPVKAQEVAA